MSRTVTIPQAIEIALTHHRAGEMQQAEQIYRQVLQQDANNFDALQLLGTLAHQVGRSDMAMEFLTRAIAIAPQAPHPHNNLGQALVRLGRVDEAIESYRKAVALKPDYLEAWTNLGDAMDSARRFPQAASAYREAVKLAPKNAALCNKLGASLLDIPELDESREWLEKAIALEPNFILAMNNLGRCEQARGDFKKAIEWYEKVIAAEPNQPEPHLNLALALLSVGDFERGHEEYEWRLKCPAWVAHPELALPKWKGEDLAGKTLLLHVEQGFGDTFQLIRYAPILAARGARVISGARPESRNVLASVEGVVDTVVPGEPMPKVDVYAQLPSVPRLMHTTIETIPQNVPYIFADENLKRVWRERVEAAGGKLRVGLTWRGQMLPYPNRSFALKTAFALARNPDVVYHSLVLADGAHEIGEAPSGMRIVDHSAELSDFSDTAALMANLDLIVSVDTATAHLAGAMGLPTLTLLPFAASHQWLRDRSDSPWYPTMTLIRQTTEGDWNPVFKAAADAIDARLK